jgi:hypothetical protein
MTPAISTPGRRTSSRGRNHEDRRQTSPDHRRIERHRPRARARTLKETAPSVSSIAAGVTTPDGRAGLRRAIVRSPSQTGVACLTCTIFRFLKRPLVSRRCSKPSNNRRDSVKAGRALSIIRQARRGANNRALSAPFIKRRGGGRDRPRVCENAKVLGFRVSLYPSRVAAKPIRRDLKGRFFRTPLSACVFTHPRPEAANGISRSNVC